MTRSAGCVLGWRVVREQIETVIRDVLSPLFEADGASLELVDVDESVVRIRLGGIYRGCPSLPYTLEGVVLPALRQIAGRELQVEVVN